MNFQGSGGVFLSIPLCLQYTSSVCSSASREISFIITALVAFMVTLIWQQNRLQSVKCACISKNSTTTTLLLFGQKKQPIECCQLVCMKATQAFRNFFQGFMKVSYCFLYQLFKLPTHAHVPKEQNTHTNSHTHTQTH